MYKQNKPDTPAENTWICPISTVLFLIKHTRILNFPIT